MEAIASVDVITHPCPNFSDSLARLLFSVSLLTGIRGWICNYSHSFNDLFMA